MPATIKSRDDPLEGSPQPPNAHIGENQIRSLAPLSGHPALKKLSLVDNPISNASAITSIGTLEHLDLNFTQIESVQGFDKLVNLKKLLLANVPIKDITPVASLPALELLDIQGTFIPQEQIAALKSTRPNLKIYHDKVTRTPGQPAASP